MIAAILTVFLFAGSGVLATRATRLLDPGRANLLRFFIALTVLGVWMWISQADVFGPGSWLFMISGLIGFGIGDTALFEAYSRIGSRRALLLMLAISAPIAAIIELLWLGDPLSWNQILCIAVILVGVLMALGRNPVSHASERKYLMGLLFGLVAACCQGLGTVVSRKAFLIALEAGEPMNALTSTFLRLGAGIWIPAGIVLWNLWRKHSTAGKLSREACLLCAATGILGPVLGVACFQFALSSTPSAVVLAIVATTPLVVMPLSWWSEADRPSLASVTGAALAVAGVIGLFLLPGAG